MWTKKKNYLCIISLRISIDRNVITDGNIEDKFRIREKNTSVCVDVRSSK